MRFSGLLSYRPYIVFSLPAGVSFPQRFASVVAAMFRSLACRCAVRDNDPFPGDSELYVAGHLENMKGVQPRFSYFPLLSLTSKTKTDGTIRHLLLTEPYGGSGEYIKWAERNLLGEYLIDKDGCHRGVLGKYREKDTSLTLDYYVKSSSRWCSITPVVLPGFDDKKISKAKKLFLRSIEQEGIPQEIILEFELYKTPVFSGSLPPLKYIRPGYLKSFSCWHAIIEFKKPVLGPLALGAGRHCGLGIFVHCG